MKKGPANIRYLAKPKKKTRYSKKNHPSEEEKRKKGLKERPVLKGWQEKSGKSLSSLLLVFLCVGGRGGGEYKITSSWGEDLNWIRCLDSYVPMSWKVLLRSVTPVQNI